MNRPLLSAVDIKSHYETSNGSVKAVDGVSLDVSAGETVGLVGESGCGKSTLGRTLLRLESLTSGRIEFDGRDISALGGEELRRARRDMQMVFQDPLGSLNPRMRVWESVADPIRAHGLVTGRRAIRQRVEELFGLVGLGADHLDRFPQGMSGGQRQRVAIARALAVEPRFLVADEAVASLDVSIGAQVVNLLADLQRRLGLAYLFISHDLAMVHHVSDRVAVMYLGKIVELSAADDVFVRPRHPYTVALLSATPGQVALGRERILLHGDPPSPLSPPTGCRFHTRCPIGPLDDPTRTVCRDVEPELNWLDPTTAVACHFPNEVAVTLTSPDRTRDQGGVTS